jgi:prephenate dehydrogenase
VDVQVVGLGLIGGSIAAACRRAGMSVRGVDADPAVTAQASRLGLVDAVGCGPAEVGFVAVPAAVAPGVVRSLFDVGVVSDVSGVKEHVVDRCDGPRFVGGHPFAGSEQSGPDAARADLFDGAAWVLTPGRSTLPASTRRVVEVVTALGAQPLVMSPRDHDRLAAAVSHVPHLVAAAMASAAGILDGIDARVRDVVAGGFGDVTRVASSPVSFWPHALVANRDQVLGELDRFAAQLSELRDAVDAGDEDALASMLERARRARQMVVDAEAVLEVEVRDEPGVIAAVLAVLADAHIDVADVELVPLLDRHGATLRVVVDADDAGTAARQVSAAGWVVTGGV